MTNEEAIEYLKWMRPKKPWSLDKKNTQTAIDKAIKALEQETCDDCVSRNAIIRTLNTMDRYVSDELTLCDTDSKFPKNEVFIVDDVYELIVEQLPSVTPQPKIGKWEKYGVLHCGEQHYKCTACDNYINFGVYSDYYLKEFKYCPICGARMVDLLESEE